MIYTKILILIFFTVIDLNCECSNTYGYSKVNWNTSNQQFEDTVISLGEKELSIEFETCSKKGKTIYLKGKILDEDMLYNNSDKLKNNVVLLKCSNKGKVIDTLDIIEVNGYFDVNFKYKNQDYIVYKNISDSTGYKILMKGFN